MKKAKETEIRAEVENLRSLDKDDLRARWCKTFGKEPPPALTKDLLGRMIAWRIQEKFYGGHDKATIKLLDGLVRGEAEKLEAGPRLKPGTVLMREHRGVRHTVTVVLNGFRLAGADLSQPHDRCPRHHRDLVERAAFLRPAHQT